MASELAVAKRGGDGVGGTLLRGGDASLAHGSQSAGSQRGQLPHGQLSHTQGANAQSEGLKSWNHGLYRLNYAFRIQGRRC